MRLDNLGLNDIFKRKHDMNSPHSLQQPPLAPSDGAAFQPQLQHIGWSEQQDVGMITLQQIGRKNALTFESYAELKTVFQQLHDVPAIKAVVLTGAGHEFCSGGDVHHIIGPLLQMKAPELLAFTRMTGDVVAAMRKCPQPIVAAIDGICVGAGAALAMAADVRLGTSRSRTAFLFSRVGLAGCDMGACALLPRIIGLGRASELLFSGRIMLGDEAERWGFFNRLCAPDDLPEESLRWAKDCASGPSFAHQMTKTMLQQEWNMGLEQALEAEAQAQALCMLTQDFARAYEAFVHKLTPTFQGN
jgi:enoyl-CoA hydratase/carnithine racemase